MGHESYTRVDDQAGSSERAFGLVFAAVFGVIALWPVVLQGAPRWWSLALAGVFAAVAVAAPRMLVPLNRLWFKFGLLLHRIVSPIVLGIMFFLVITPMGLVMRAFGKDPLRLRREPGVASYWIARTPPGPEPETLKDQF